MTQDNDAADSEINRRTVLKSAAAASAVGLVGIPAFSGSAVAQSSEALYLTDSGGDNGFTSTGTKLYEVDLVTENGTNKAKLNLLDERTSSNFDQVDAIAATPDGDVVYYVDKNSERLGKYDVENDSFSDEGPISGLPEDEVVLAAYSPSGTFYAAGQVGDELFTVDPNGPSARKVADITGVDVQGADIAFDAFGTLYLFSSNDGKLYTVNLNTGEATEVDTAQSNKGSYTGLAIRDAGAGDLVGSSTSDDTIYEIDKSSGAEGTGYRMYEGGSTYDYGFGDMTVGRLCTPCETDGALAKYEFKCVDYDEEECLNYDFTLEGDGDTGISYAGDNYENKEGEENEPVSVTFETEYCDLVAIVKAGPEEHCVDADVEGGVATVDIEEDERFKNDSNEKQYAISYVEFYCECPE